MTRFDRRSLLAALCMTLTAAFATLSPAPARALESSEAETLVQSASDEIVSLIRSSASESSKQSSLATIITRYFAIGDIARASIGRPWRDMSPTQQNAYENAFLDYVARIYVGRFSAYGGQTLAVTSSADGGNRGVFVKSHIDQNGGERIEVEWRIMDRNGPAQIFDISVEGVSLVTTQRSEFSSLLEQVNFDFDQFISRLNAN